MPVHNAEIAALFERLADLLEIQGANPFRVRAYRNAARTIAGHPEPMAELVARGADLKELPGIGEALAGKITTIVRSGRLPALDEAARRTPAVLSDLMRIPGVGPKRVRRLHESLGLRSVEDLKRAATSGLIRGLPGFGAKTEQMILAGTTIAMTAGARVKLRDAEAMAAPLVAWLAKTPGVGQVEVAGSLRRRKETVGDLDILATAATPAKVMQRLAAYDEVIEVLAHGETRSTVRLRSGLQVDLRVVPEASYGAALHYFTGSKAHNVAVRARAQKKGLKLNEYGVFRGRRRVAGRTEKDVFAAVGLPLIAPELREGAGEIEAAARHALPELVTPEDIRGDLHCHTDASDGHDDLEAMAAAAQALGYEYLGISDHSRRVKVARGLDPRRLLGQIREIDRLNARLGGITLLKSCEVDILADGRLDLPDSVLKELDFTVCSVHYDLQLPAKKQTARILRAMDNRYFTILGHPTGRLINERPACELAMEKIIAGAKERGCYLEVNAHPDRLDLDGAGCRAARAAAVKVAIATDAHSGRDLELMRFGVDQARRGWLEAGDVLNTRSLTELRKLFRR
jgi:DNA polymerase (family 10)